MSYSVLPQPLFNISSPSNFLPTAKLLSVKDGSSPCSNFDWYNNSSSGDIDYCV